MIKSMITVGVAGFALGWAALTHVGVPLVVPSYNDLRGQLIKTEGFAIGQTGRADEEAQNRKIEAAQAIAGVTDERARCQAQLDDQARAYTHALNQMEARLEAPAHCPDDRRLRPLHGLYGSASRLDDDRGG